MLKLQDEAFLIISTVDEWRQKAMDCMREQGKCIEVFNDKRQEVQKMRTEKVDPAFEKYSLKKKEKEEVGKEHMHLWSQKEVAQAASSLASANADKMTEKKLQEDEEVKRMITSIEDTKRKMQADCDKAIESLSKMR